MTLEGFKEVSATKPTIESLLPKIEGFSNSFKETNITKSGIERLIPKIDWDSNKLKEDNSFEVKDYRVETINENIEKIPCRNEALEGKAHPETGVEFEKKVVENEKGELKEVTVPKFDSEFDAQLPKELYEATDRAQFKECNKQLNDEIQKNPELKSKFSSDQLEQIKDGKTPDGYTWHHDAEKGKMQLVNSEDHAKTGHTGGKTIWGGGSENR